MMLKLLLPEERSDAVHRLWSGWVDRDTEVTAPFLLAYEVVSVLRNKVFRRELTPEAGEAALAAFVSQDVSLLHPPGIEEAAWALARRWTCPRPTTRCTSRWPRSPEPSGVTFPDTDRCEAAEQVVSERDIVVVRKDSEYRRTEFGRRRPAGWKDTLASSSRPRTW